MKAEYYLHMGDDDMVADAARVSFSKEASNFTNEQNEKLIRYLAKHNHFTPFTHPQITLRMQAPVPIRTQCFKSKVGFSENEESRRYVSHSPSLYIPDVFRSKPENAKQGSGDQHQRSDLWKGNYLENCRESIRLYEDMIKDRVAPEQARFILPQGVEVEWFWTGSLAAYARFCNLRKDFHAQLEIQQLAEMVESVVQPLFPVCWKNLVGDNK